MPVLAGVLVCVLAVATTELVVWLLHQHRVEQQRSDVLHETATVRARLEGEINSTLYLTRGLIAYVATHPEVPAAEFSTLASEIISTARSIRNIGLAKDNVITHIYPLAGNEAALGLEYAKIPTQWPAVLRAMETKGTIVAGPVDLAQGGRAFIARTPIYTRSGVSGVLGTYRPRYWGLASVVIDIQALFQAAGFSDRVGNVAFALRGTDAQGAEGGMILGDPQIFVDEPVLSTVALPNGSWQLAARPVDGWGVGLSGLWIPRLAGWILAAVLGYLIAALLWAREVNRALALHDDLTKLPNRRLLEDRLERSIAANSRNGGLFGLFFLDLDDFKQVNDTHGHKIGDRVLCEAAKRMQLSIRAGDTVARTGGDEFIILVDGISHREDMDKIRFNLERSLSIPALIDGRPIELSASIGEATYPEDGESVDALLTQADKRMYSEKRGGNVHRLDAIRRS